MIALAVLLIGALAVDVELTYVHVKLKTVAGYKASCDLNKTASCSSVLNTKYAVLGGVPVSIWAIVFHLLMLIVLIVGRVTEDAEEGYPFGLLFGMALFSLLFSGYMAAVSAFVIKHLCPWCAVLYALALVIFGVLWAALRRAGGGVFAGIFADLRAFFGHTGLALSLSISTVVVGAGLVLTYPKLVKPPVKELPPSLELILNTGVEQGHPWIGPYSAKQHRTPIDVYEFSDYECPFCKASHRRLRSLLLKNRHLPVRFFHRHFPLDDACNPRASMHPFACQAAYMTNCAQRQNRFWQMNDLLFYRQDLLQNGDAEKLIPQVPGLNAEIFNACMEDKAVVAKVKKDIALAIQIGINGTPGYLIPALNASGCTKVDGKFKAGHGCLVVGALDEATFLKIVVAVAQSKGITISKSPTPPKKTRTPSR